MIFKRFITKIHYDKPLHILNEITDFAFKDGTRDYVTVYISGVSWSRLKSNTRRSYSFQERISSWEFIVNNSYFQVYCKIFCQVIGIPMRSEPAPFFANLVLFLYQSKWLESIKNANYRIAKKFDIIFIFIDDLIAINDGNDFKSHYSKTYQPEIVLKTKNTSPTETTFIFI